jgi:hypothetical protein
VLALSPHVPVGAGAGRAQDEPLEAVAGRAKRRGRGIVRRYRARKGGEAAPVLALPPHGRWAGTSGCTTRRTRTAPGTKEASVAAVATAVVRDFDLNLPADVEGAPPDAKRACTDDYAAMMVVLQDFDWPSVRRRMPSRHARAMLRVVWYVSLCGY